jgi:hypothetical protein
MQIQTDYFCISLDINYIGNASNERMNSPLGIQYMINSFLFLFFFGGGGKCPFALHKNFAGQTRIKFIRQIFVLAMLNKNDFIKTVVLFLR